MDADASAGERRPRRVAPFAAIAVPAAACMLAAPAQAQVGRAPAGGEPAWWIGAAVGVLSPGDVRDGRTQSTWDFGESVQYRGGVERSLGGGATIGATAGFARVPLTYVSHAVAAAPCARCDAEADVWSLMATFRHGGGAGFHQVIEANAGWTRFTSFRRTDGEGELPPEGDSDFAFAIGYGFGYGLSSRTQIVLVQDFAFLLHQREGLAGGDRSLVRQSSTRIGVRLGAGTRR